MFQRFYPDEAESQASFFSQKVLSYGKDVSAAQVQGLFLMYKHSPDQALYSINIKSLPKMLMVFLYIFLFKGKTTKDNKDLL
jgi:hypothetical protein